MSENQPPDNPVELEIFKHLFASVAEEMGVRLMRSAYSPNIKERRDYSCALFDGHGDLLAQAAHIPVHLGSTPMSLHAVLDAFPPASMKPGDRFIVNDPFAGGTHLPDITVIAPVFVTGDDAGRMPAFFVVNRAHHADVGGIAPGSLPMSKTIDEEGIRVPPSRLDDAMINRIAQASRTPDERRGDLAAQCAALQAGSERLLAMVERHGLNELQRQGGALKDYTERILRHLIASIPDGSYSFEDVLDDDGHGICDIAIRCTLTIDDESARVDFTKTDDQVTGPVNAVRAIAVSAVNYAFRCLAPPDIPANAGVMRPIDVVTRPGSLLDAFPPAAVAGGNVETSQRIVDVLLGALAKALPDRVPAASGGSMNNLTIGGIDRRFDPPRPFAYYETIACGAGAGPHGDGQSAIHTHMTNTLNTPIEALEHAYPFRVVEYALRDASHDVTPSRHGVLRGGHGVIRAYLFDVPAEVTLLTERRTRPPYGLRGGQIDSSLAGEKGVNVLIHADGRQESLPGKCTIKVNAGDTLRIATPGGGPWSRF